jgi:hypothetical protein
MQECLYLNKLPVKTGMDPAVCGACSAKQAAAPRITTNSSCAPQAGCSTVDTTLRDNSRQTWVTPGPYIIMPLMRGSGLTVKHNRCVTAPVELDMAQWAPPSYSSLNGSGDSWGTASDSALMYDLVASVRHTGLEAKDGHYLAEVRRGDGRWHECNDSAVTGMDQPSVAAAGGDPHVFMVLYKRRESAVERPWWS